MANEATIQTTLSIRTGSLSYQSQPSSFRADVAGTKGPTPGAIAVAIAGTDVAFSELTTPALCRLQNLDETNFVEYGIWDGIQFYPLGELLPGESYVIRLSRNLTEEYGTGTGTTGAAANTFRLKADTAACVVLVEAFEV
jgi:hypothetical protein